MTDAGSAYQGYLLRSIATQIGADPTPTIAQMPGVQAVYRVTVHYHDARCYNSVATLTRGVVGNPTLTIQYEHAPYATVHDEMDVVAFKQFMQALQKARYDHLSHQASLPTYGIDLWLVERAASGFSKDVILAPYGAKPPYIPIIEAVNTYIPQALREIPQR